MDENNLENRGNIITGIPREHESPNKIKQSRISRKKNSREFPLQELPIKRLSERNEKVSEVSI